MFVTLRRTTLVSSPERYRGNKRANNSSIELPSPGIISNSLKGLSSFLSQHTRRVTLSSGKGFGRRIKEIKTTGENIAIIPLNIVSPFSIAVRSLPSAGGLEGER